MENISTIKNSSKKIKLDFKDSKYATGRRKKSVARVWVKKGSGNIHVNGKKMKEYFKRPVHQIIVTRPLEISNVLNLYDVKASVKGGGLSGQAGAIIHGLSRALVSYDENLKKTLKKEKLTTRDSRVVERKNTVTEKQEEASNFLKDKSVFYYSIHRCYKRFMSLKKLNIAIVGATGFVGLDLVYYLSKHPKISIKYLLAQKNTGKKKYKHLIIELKKNYQLYPNFKK